MKLSKSMERDARIRSDLKNSVNDGCCYSVMVGMGESYLSALILALGFSQLSSALITTLPLLAGAILQLVSPQAVKKLGSYSKWVVSAACLQAASFFIFVAAAFYKDFPLWSLYLAASIYWAASMATGPAWNAWIAKLVPAKIRTDFFSRRSRWTYVTTLIGLMGGGLALEIGRRRGVEMQTFMFIFTISAILRFTSAYFLSRQSEPKGIASQLHLLSFPEAFAKIRTQNYGRILLYLFFLQIAVNISSSYFNPYMLTQLKLPYWSYMMIVCMMVLSKAITMPITLKLIKKFGLKKVLIGAAMGIAPLPIAWLGHSNLAFLTCLQLLSGFVWATHELCTFLILFSEIPEEDRASVLTEFNLFNTVGIVLGSIVGGIIFHNLGENLNGYYVIFFLSSLFRFACIFMIPSMGSPIKKAGLRIYYRTIGVRHGGGITRPIITNIDDANAKTHSVVTGAKQSGIEHNGIFNKESL